MSFALLQSAATSQLSVVGSVLWSLAWQRLETQMSFGLLQSAATSQLSGPVGAGAGAGGLARLGLGLARLGLGFTRSGLAGGVGAGSWETGSSFDPGFGSLEPLFGL